MKTSLSNSITNFLSFIFCFLLVGVFNSCEKDRLPNEDLNATSTLEAKAKAVKSDNGFKAFHQGFEANTKAWADQEVPGILGWCGTIALHDRKTGEIEPSKGNGYAVIEWGECNYFWSSDPADNPDKVAGTPVFTHSAPATQDPDLWSTSWPSNGYTQQVDIYLDPSMFDEGTAFSYFNSVFVPMDENHFRYFAVYVEKVDDHLEVLNETISEEGWYTFRYAFSSDMDGNLLVTFELWKDKEQVLASTIGSTFYTRELTSTIPTSGLGSGYIWFESLQEGVGLPIDEHYLSPANSGNAHR